MSRLASDREPEREQEEERPISNAKKIILFASAYLLTLLIAVVGGNPLIHAPTGIVSRYVYCICVYRSFYTINVLSLLPLLLTPSPSSPRPLGVVRGGCSSTLRIRWTIISERRTAPAIWWCCGAREWCRYAFNPLCLLCAHVFNPLYVAGAHIESAGRDEEP
jgi:hypothetical protein